MISTPPLSISLEKSALLSEGLENLVYYCPARTATV